MHVITIIISKIWNNFLPIYTGRVLCGKRRGELINGMEWLSWGKQEKYTTLCDILHDE